MRRAQKGDSKSGPRPLARGLTSKIHLAVRGLGLPVRFLLTAGQRNDITQAQALVAGLPAEQVIADTAYDADPSAGILPPRGLKRSSPPTPPGPESFRSIPPSTRKGISSNAASTSSSISAASPPATKNRQQLPRLHKPRSHRHLVAMTVNRS